MNTADLDAELADARAELAEAEAHLRDVRDRRADVNAETLARHRLEHAQRRVTALLAAQHHV